MGTYKLQVDWKEYDRLKGLGWLDKEIAKAFGISPSTLSVRLKERCEHGGTSSGSNTM